MAAEQLLRDSGLTWAVLRLPFVYGEGDGHLAQPGQRPDQPELVLGQVVEAVEEDRPGTPEGAVAAQLGDRLAGDPVGVGAAAALPDLAVAPVEGGDVAEVGGALEGGGARLDLLGLDPRRLQLVEQAPERGGEAGTAGGAAQGAEALAAGLDRDRDRPPALGGGELGSGRRPARRGDGAEEGAEGHHRAAEDGAPRDQLALAVEDVVGGGEDEDGVAVEALPEGGQDVAELA